MKEEDLVKSIMKRMTPYGKAMDEILEERVKETKAYKELLEENKKLKSDVSVYKSQRYAYKQKYLALLEANTELEEENKKLKEEKEFFYKSAKQFREENENLKETIKDHQLYEEKLEHRIIEFEELLHGE